VLDWRDPAGGRRPQGAAAADYEAAGSPVRPRGVPFEVVEDLRQVLGMTPERFHVLRPHVTIHGRGDGVAPLAAPVGVLAILAGGDEEEAARIDRLRAAGEVTLDLTRLRQAHLGSGHGAIFRIEGIMPAGGARQFVRTWWVDLEVPSPSGLPWRTLTREAARTEHPEPLEDEG
jgi:general secretion pathway protein K